MLLLGGGRGWGLEMMRLHLTPVFRDTVLPGARSPAGQGPGWQASPPAWRTKALSFHATSWADLAGRAPGPPPGAWVSWDGWLGERLAAVVNIAVCAD